MIVKQATNRISTHLPEAMEPSIFSERPSLLITMCVVPSTQLVELGAQVTPCSLRNLEMAFLSSSEYPDRMNILGGEGVGPKGQERAQLDQRSVAK